MPAPVGHRSERAKGERSWIHARLECAEAFRASESALFRWRRFGRRRS